MLVPPLSRLKKTKASMSAPAIAGVHHPRKLKRRDRNFLYRAARESAAGYDALFKAQDQMALSLFSLSLLLATASGLFGSLEAELSLRGAATLCALMVTLAVWVAAWAVYRPREHCTGLAVQNMVEDMLAGQLHGRPRDAALESLVRVEGLNEAVAASRGRWLPILGPLLAMQVGLLLVMEVTAT